MVLMIKKNHEYYLFNLLLSSVVQYGEKSICMKKQQFKRLENIEPLFSNCWIFSLLIKLKGKNRRWKKP